MAAKKQIDIIFAGIVLSIVLYGILILAGVSAPFSMKYFGSPSAYLFHQLFYGILPGLFLCGLLIFIPLKKLQRFSFFLFLLSSLTLLLVFFPPFGIKLGGASRWIAVGPISFQPSELIKLTFILYWSALLATKLQQREKKMERNLFSVAPLSLLLFLSLSLILGILFVLQPDISTLGIVLGSGFLMYFVARTPLWHSVAIGGIAIAALAMLIKLAPYRLNRFLVFLDPSTDPMGIGYQVKQALIAVGSGKLFGMGLGMGANQVKFLPAAMSDAVFAAISQEIGFIGSFSIVALFFLFIWRGFRIAKRASDEFSKLAAVGITCWIGMQAFINIGAITGFLPLTGIPLPFISYGGSHLLAELAAVGILLNISRDI
jgi:cell division protein FtsW